MLSAYPKPMASENEHIRRVVCDEEGEQFVFMTTAT